jgi:WD40 repeat protein
MYGHSQRVVAVTFHPNGSEIASCCYDGAVRIWGLGSGSPVAVLPCFAETLSFTPDGTRLLAASRTEVRVWDTATYGGTILRRAEERFNLPGGRFWRTFDWCTGTPRLALAIAPDNTRIVTGFDDGTLEIWDGPQAK